MKKIFYLLVIALSAVFTSCKKEKKAVYTDDAVKDSIYYYAKEDYLWFDQLPSYAAFNPSSFTNADALTGLQTEVNALSQYAVNPATGLPYEYDKYAPGEAKYSFIDAGEVAAELNGTKGDFGFGLEYYKFVNDLRIDYVYAGSPADKAGIKRGDQITAINGSTNISYDSGSFGNGTNINYVNNAIFNSSTVTLTLKKPDSTSVTVNLSTASYNVNPVLKDSIYDAGNGHKVGYIVFNSFTSDAVADPQLDPVFANFTAQGITDLVVDLRYNGGGYVSTAEHLDNLIVPAAKTGSVMYTATYNTNLQTDKDPLISKKLGTKPGDFLPANNQVMFSKTGALAVNRVFFIITGQTASASELTINNLRPVMDVQMIGDTSYGKPVGFFAIDLSKYKLYIPEFSTQNSANQGGYYGGFTPGSASYPGFQDYDDASKDFGDTSEGLLAHVMAYVKTGSYATAGIQHTVNSVRNLSVRQARSASLSFNPKRFTGMIGSKKKSR